MAHASFARRRSLLLALVVLGTVFAGCATNGPPTTTTTSPTTTTPTPTPTTTTPTPTVTPTLPTLPVSGPLDTYAITTGSSTGVYFAIGNGIVAAVRNATAAGFSITEAATSQGSIQNIQRLRDDDHQLALTQNDVAYYAYRGEDRYAGNAYTDLRALAALYPEMVQIVTLRSSTIDSLDDLAGKRVAIGAAGSGVSVNAGHILNASGVSASTENMDLATSVARLKDGGIDAFFWTGGVPTAAVVDLSTTHPVRVLPVPADVKAKLQRDYPFYANATMLQTAYSGLEGPVETVAVMALLVARADVAGDDVAALMRILFESGEVQRAHAQGANIKLDNAFNGVVGVPWHDGARYYYISKGRTPPGS